MQPTMKNDTPPTIYWLIIAMIAMCVIALTAGCKEVEYVTVPEYHTDTLRETRNIRDSIYLHDSIHVKELGDTVWIERWHTSYRDRLKTDTVYHSRVDSVPFPVEIEKEVAAPLTWWQKTQMYAGDALLVILMAAAGFGAWKIYRKIRLI